MKETTKIIFTDALGREHVEQFETSPKDSSSTYGDKFVHTATKVHQTREKIKKGKD